MLVLLQVLIYTFKSGFFLLLLTMKIQIRLIWYYEVVSKVSSPFKLF